MNPETTTRLRITGFAIVVAAIVSTWTFGAFGQKATPGPGTAPASASAPATSASVPTATAVVTAPGKASDALVERGLYLARAGDCISCHTGPGRLPFAGGLPMKTPFGTIVSTNITPDRSGGIGDYTEADFARALREGVRRDGRHLYPAMPYTSFARIDDADMHALYAYFQRGVAPVASKPAETALPWPFSMRWLMVGWNFLYLEPGVYAPDAARGAEWNRGAYLVQGLGHCGECHTPRNSLTGGVKSTSDRRGDSFLAGALIDGWYAQPLRHADRPTAAQWSSADLVAFLGTGRTAHTAAFGGMSEVVENSTQYLTSEDLGAIASYLKTVGAPVGPAMPDLSPQAAAVAAADTHPDTLKLRAGTVEGAGAMVYLNNCNACHRSSGAGAKGVFPSLSGNSVVNAKDPTSLIHIVLGGSAMPSTDRSPSALAMPRFGWRLTDGNVADLLSYVRTAWGNRAEPVTPAQVAAVRETVKPAALAQTKP
jgi:mono/diheme cytochrome c family protein